MIAAELPAPETREAERLQCLAELGLAGPGADAEPDAVLDGLVRCAAHLLGFPVALVSLVGERRVWFKARYGIDLTGDDRDTSFCAHAIRGETLFEVPDAHADPRFAASACVTGGPRLRAYAGLPIRLDGLTLGALCVADTVPRRLDAVQATLLADIANAVAAWFSHRREHADLLASRADLQDRAELLMSLSRETPGMLFQYRKPPGQRGRLSFVSGQAEAVFGALAPLQPPGLRSYLERCHRDDLRGLLRCMADAAHTHQPWQHLFRVCLPDRLQPGWRSVHASPSRLADGTVLWHGFIADVDEHVEVARLRRDKEAAERASAEKSAFLSRASHELRTPLNAVLGFSQLLLLADDEPLTARQRERIEWVLSSAQRLHQLVDGLLDLDRAEAIREPEAANGPAADAFTLLYIEDEPLNTLLVQEALRERRDWQVLHAADGRSGLALARTRRPEVVLADINLPGISGLEVVSQLRADPALADTLCIALSADATPTQIERAMQAGFDDYWTKPLDVLELAGRLADALARHGGR
ncbi:response regulator [Roseateles sp. BYS78W]|uniref:histidine kinase n=1 Tax=Pelomonas candidula TaxID=3299025 RepID=A0ABW7HE55_9BURK